MRRDLITGILVSFILIFGSAFISQKMKSGPPAKKAADKDPTIAIVMRELPPEEPEKLETQDDLPKPVEIAPPMLTDVPQLVKPDEFVMAVQITPPNMVMNTGIISIPKGDFGSGNYGTVFDVSQLDEKPQYTYRPSPAYPDAMKKQGITATVVIGFIVDNTGAVRDVRVISSPQSEFNKNAVKAVESWKFKPGKKGGRAVTTMMEVPIVFQIKAE